MPIKIGKGRSRNIKYQGLFLLIDSISDSLVFIEIMLIKANNIKSNRILG